MLKKFYELFSNDIGIDLGTSNTLVYLKNHGIVVNESSVVAINQKTNQVVAVGNEARDMIGRTPGHIKAIRPLVDGVISDFDVTLEMLSYLINKAEKQSKKLLGPRVVIGVPSSITSVETRAVYDAAKSAGAREVYIVEEPMAAAIGIQLPVKEPVGSMIIDIGGGTSDIAVISLGGIVRSKNIRIAGDTFNNDIVTYLKDEHKFLIGEKTAESVKISIGSVAGKNPVEAEIRGRDLVTGLPRKMVLTDVNIREALHQSMDDLIDGIKEVLETTPPEILSDVMHRGITLVGGGALIQGFDELLRSILKIPIHVSDDPLTAVVRGTGFILEDLDNFEEVLISTEDELSLQ